MPLPNYTHWFIKRGGWLVLLILACVVLSVVAGRIPSPGILPGQLGPGFWPRAVLLVLILCCVLKMVDLVRYHPSTLNETKGLKGSFSKSNQKVVVGSVFMAFGFVLATQVLGFLLSCLIFLWAFTYMAGWRHKVYLPVISIVGAISITYLFVKLVYIPLPKGLGFFEDINIMIYRALGIF